jgi:hypothetical protein
VPSWVISLAALLSCVIVSAVLVLYLPTLSAAALLAIVASVIVSIVMMLYLPMWASLSIALAIVVVAMIGGEELLLKTLIIGGLLVLARWLWRRYVPRWRRS